MALFETFASSTLVHSLPGICTDQRPSYIPCNYIMQLVSLPHDTISFSVAFVLLGWSVLMCVNIF